MPALKPLDHILAKDDFLTYAAWHTVAGQLDNNALRTDTGHNLYKNLKAKLSESAIMKGTDKAHGHLFQQQQAGLIEAIVTVAAITPLAQHETQAAIAADLEQALYQRHGDSTIYDFNKTDLNHFYQQNKEFAVAFNRNMAPDWCYDMDDRTVDILDTDFRQTPACQVGRIYQDNIILTIDDKRNQAQAVIAAYKNDTLS